MNWFGKLLTNHAKTSAEYEQNASQNDEYATATAARPSSILSAWPHLIEESSSGSHGVNSVRNVVFLDLRRCLLGAIRYPEVVGRNPQTIECKM
jgi:hypothetical protein